MLSAYSAEIVGLIGPGFTIHLHCAVERYGELQANLAEAGLHHSLSPISRYSIQSEWPEGLSCDHCGEWIVEPSEDYPNPDDEDD